MGVFCIFPIANAQTIPSPGHGGVSVEWLYMQSSIDQPYFAMELQDRIPDIIGSINRISNEEGWHSGYRLEFIYSFCDCFNDIRVRWTHFPSFSNSRNFTGAQNVIPVIPFIVPGLPSVFDEAKIRDTYDFFYLDVLLGQTIMDCACFTLDLQGGVQYGHLDLDEDITFFGTINGSSVMAFEEKFKSHLWGIGPEIGTELSYYLGYCLSLTGRSYGSLLISKREVKSQNLLGIFDATSSENTDYWRVIPTLNLRFGLSFTRQMGSCFCMGPFNLDIEAGYEAIWFFHGVERTYFTTEIGSTDGVQGQGCFNELMTFTLHGPYIKVGIAF